MKRNRILELRMENFRIACVRSYRKCEDGATFQLEGVVKTREDMEKVVSFISQAVDDPTLTVDNLTYIKSSDNNLYTNSAIIKRDLEELFNLPEGYDDCYIKD